MKARPQFIYFLLSEKKSTIIGLHNLFLVPPLGSFTFVLYFYFFKVFALDYRLEIANEY